MTAVLEFLNRGATTLDEAKDEDENFIHTWECDEATRRFYRELWQQKSTIKALIKHHLGLSHEDVSILHATEWIRGSFNVCMLINVTSSQTCRKYMMRCAMPHQLTESRYPGTTNEKLSCEVGAYAWMQDNCPDIRIPHLYGFGFSDHRHFTHEEQRPWYIRLAHRFRRCLYSLVRYPALSHYTANPTSHCFPTAYMLLEHIGPEIGTMLSETWEDHRHDPACRKRLFQSMAHAILSLARIPQPRIGAFRFHDDCTITLTNRPLLSSWIMLENKGAKRTVQQETTFQCTESFVSDVLTLHDNYFLCNPNAVYDDQDCYGQMAAMTLLRTVAHRHIRKDQRDGPFFLQFTDLHASNMFVDDEWNIKCVLDLEWICALPVEMISVPYWLTGRALNHLRGEHLHEYNQVREEFMQILEEQECGIKAGHSLSIPKVMHEGWASGSEWFWHLMDSVGALYSVVEGHIYPRFATNPDDMDEIEKMEKVLATFWQEDSLVVVESKVNEHKMYTEQLQLLYMEKSKPTAKAE